MQERSVVANGATLHVETFGERSDPVTLLIMGATASAVWWPEEFCRSLAAQGRYVIRYDHRDTGRSTSYPPGEPGYSVDDLADDAIAILDAHEIARAHIIGMSLGGFLAQLLALKYPERVATLTLIASEPLSAGDGEVPAIDQKIIDHHMQAADLDWSDRKAVIDFITGAWRLTAGRAHAFDETGIRQLAEQDFERSENLLSSMNHAQLAGGEEWFDRLDEIRAPALIIHGNEDPVLNYRHALALVERLPAATLLTLEGSGHEIHRNEWPRIIAAITKHTG